MVMVETISRINYLLAKRGQILLKILPITMDKRNNFIVCAFCKKVIINQDPSKNICYEPILCIIHRELKKDEDSVFSIIEDSVYHYRCYVKKNRKENNKLIKDLDKLSGVVHC
jgi:hypothetical protein